MNPNSTSDCMQLLQPHVRPLHAHIQPEMANAKRRMNVAADLGVFTLNNDTDTRSLAGIQQPEHVHKQEDSKHRVSYGTRAFYSIVCDERTDARRRAQLFIVLH